MRQHCCLLHMCAQGVALHACSCGDHNTYLDDNVFLFIGCGASCNADRLGHVGCRTYGVEHMTLVDCLSSAAQPSGVSMSLVSTHCITASFMVRGWQRYFLSTPSATTWVVVVDTCPQFCRQLFRPWILKSLQPLPQRLCCCRAYWAQPRSRAEAGHISAPLWCTRLLLIAF